MDNEELLKKRFSDLANKAYKSSRPVYTDFLNINEISIFDSCCRNLDFINYNFWGGYEYAERKIIEFAPADYESERDDFPIDCIRVSPLNKKFADKLSHRDFLGAILNTGIERPKIGDIIVNDNEAFFYVNSSLSYYLIDEISRIKHTSVILSIDNSMDVSSICESRFKYISGSVSSMRADGIVALCTKASRSLSDELIKSKKLFVNSKEITKKDLQLKPGDTLSIRGYGKFIIEECGTPNSKGRFKLTIKVFQ